jgi:hypothetical protein
MAMDARGGGSTGLTVSVGGRAVGRGVDVAGSFVGVGDALFRAVAVGWGACTRLAGEVVSEIGNAVTGAVVWAGAQAARANINRAAVTIKRFTGNVFFMISSPK